jgi:hypothetical protein
MRPVCNSCQREGFGVEFPMFPKTPGFKFGTLCGDCDDAKVAETDTEVAYHLVENGYNEAEATKAWGEFHEANMGTP